MKLIIAGSRTFTDYQFLCQTLAPERHRITAGHSRAALGAPISSAIAGPWKHQVQASALLRS